MKPNFFIVGAPKCGTTAISEYLRSHPSVFMSTPKEPGYFATDLPGLRYVDTLRYYENLFQHARPRHTVVGEASPSYLYSKNAIAEIIRYNPAAKLLVMLRRPVGQLPSYHSQLCYSGFEDQTDFRRAWELQEERRRGISIPHSCREPGLLQYAKVAAFAEQLKRLYDAVPDDQVLVLLYEEFIADIPGNYRRILTFLDLPDDGRTDFPVVNSRKAARSELFGGLLHSPPTWARHWLQRAAGTRLHDLLLSLHAFLLRSNTRPSEKKALDPAFREQLVAYFADDVRRLENILQRDLESWRT